MHTARFDRLIAVMEIQAARAKAAEDAVAGNNPAWRGQPDGPYLDMDSWLDGPIPEEALNGPVPDEVIEAFGHSPKHYVGRYLKEGFCGTTACMAGYGALDAELQAQGLRLARIDATDKSARITVISFGNRTNFEALSDFFEIPRSHAHALFGGDGSSAVQEQFDLSDFTTAVSLLKTYRENPAAVVPDDDE